MIIIAFDHNEEVLDRINTLEQFGNSVQTIILEGGDEDGD